MSVPSSSPILRHTIAMSHRKSVDSRVANIADLEISEREHVAAELLATSAIHIAMRDPKTKAELEKSLVGNSPNAELRRIAVAAVVENKHCPKDVKVFVARVLGIRSHAQARNTEHAVIENNPDAVQLDGTLYTRLGKSLEPMAATIAKMLGDKALIPAKPADLAQAATAEALATLSTVDSVETVVNSEPTVIETPSGKTLIESPVSGQSTRELSAREQRVDAALAVVDHVNTMLNGPELAVAPAPVSRGLEMGLTA